MSGLYTLPNREPPEDGESLTGLIVRNAAIYDLADPRRLLSRIVMHEGIALWTLCDTDPDGELGIAMRTLLGLDEATFRRMSPWTGDVTTQSVLGHEVWRDLAKPHERAACPQCMAEKQYHRAIWNLDAMPVCAVHGTWLRRTCHVCETSLNWSTHRIACCSHFPACPGEIKDAPPDLADGRTLGGIRAMHALLTGMENAPAMPPGMQPQNVFRLSFVLGQIAFGYERDARPRGFIERHRDEMPAILDAGWSALADWPHGFNRFLDGLRTRASERSGKDGLRKAFGTLSSRVYRWAREPRGAVIGEAFAAYVAEQGDLATTAHTVSRYAPGAEIRHRFITMKEAQKVLGLSGMTINRLAERRNLYVLPPRGAGLPALMRADVFLELRREAEDSLLPEEARSALGVGPKIMAQLEDAGLIRRLPASERVLEIKPFRRSEIAAFVAACRSKGKPMSAEAAEKLSTLISPTAPGRTVPDICRAIMDGRLKVAGILKGQIGLAAIRLSLTDVDAALPSAKETMSVMDAAKQIGLKYPPVHFWIKRGFLEASSSERVGEHGMRITTEAWAAFLAEFTTSGMLADEIGQGNNTWIARHLAFLGVRPVSGADVDGGYTNLFRRSDVGPTVIKEIRSLQRGKPGTPQDKHRGSFERVATVAAVIASQWGATFTRDHNLFMDRTTGRAVQIISGRRPDLTGVFVFHTRSKSLAALAAFAEPWIALVPNEGSHFLLVPAAQAPWRGGADQETRFASLRFDAKGKPLELTEWSQAISTAPAVEQKAGAKSPPRATDYTVTTAAGVEKLWGVKLDRQRSMFTEIGGNRMVQVVPGRTEGKSIRQIFTIARAAFDRLSASPDAWVALLPKGHTGFTLVRLGSLIWRPYSTITVQASVNIDAEGRPIM
jgi:hypothetical protein